ncbi:hypothetical protein BRADI_4g10684v3 [Brachypodium distachyon]|uniref:Uncharacterized protein n=1 Tax=Brachypodium distachyon TaxID=15368 RepID=A0A2K2CLY9_BRADI|nr:hypothetical protein BRADI_4g10684v3 [Brachypodium distachyon]
MRGRSARASRPAGGREDCTRARGRETAVCHPTPAKISFPCARRRQPRPAPSKPATSATSRGVPGAAGPLRAPIQSSTEESPPRSVSSSRAATISRGPAAEFSRRSMRASPPVAAVAGAEGETSSHRPSCVSSPPRKRKTPHRSLPPPRHPPPAYASLAVALHLA